MNYIKKAKKYLKDENYRFVINALRWQLYNNMADEEYLKRMFKIQEGYDLDITNPQTFNEKLQWLKLYDRNPEYTKMVDKYEVKKIVADLIGEEYVIPTLGVWDDFEDIDFDKLPDQFVLKCTHDSGGLVICKDKNLLDIKAAKKKINKCLKRNYYWFFREWAYKDVKPRIIAEQYLEDGITQELHDYKFFAFDGIVKIMYITSDRQLFDAELKIDFFDMDLNHLDLKCGYPNAETPPPLPERFREMKDLATKLSKGIPQVRVDFYEVNGKVYFGEFTLYHLAGMIPFKPEHWNTVFGDWIKLPDKTITY